MPDQSLHLNAFGIWETDDERKIRNERLLSHPDPVIRYHLRKLANLAVGPEPIPPQWKHLAQSPTGSL